MKKPSKLALTLLASFLAEAALPINMNSSSEKSSSEETSLECKVGEQPDIKRTYTHDEISQIIHDVYRCTPSKPDYFSENFLREIIIQESTNNPKRISGKRARGLMQIRPNAWREVEKERNYYEYVFDPRTNLEIGTKYLLWIDRKFEEDYNGWEKLNPKEKRKMVLSAYNAGIYGFKRKGWELDKMPRETRNYVENIISRLETLGN